MSRIVRLLRPSLFPGVRPVRPAPLCPRRSFHSSPLLNAKKKKDDDEFDPFVEEEDIDDELISMEPTTSSLAKPSSPSSDPQILASSRFPDSLIESRHAAWSALHTSLTGHLSRESTAQERASLNPKEFRRLINWAQSKDEWQKTADLVDLWRTALRRDNLKIERLLGRYWYMLRRQAKPISEQISEASNFSAPSSLKDIDSMFSAEASNTPSVLTLLTPSERGGLEELSTEEDYTTRLGKRRALWNAFREQIRTRLVTDKDKAMAPWKSMLRVVVLAQTQEEFREATELLAVWRQSKGLIDRELTDHFLGRCVSLGMPQFAVEVLVDRPKYGIDLPTLYRAHTLFHALLTQTQPGDPTGTVPSAFTLASLMSTGTFPHILQDDTSALLLVAICHKAGTEEAQLKGAEVLDDLKAWRETEGRGGPTAEEKARYEHEGFIFPLRKSMKKLTAAERTWRKSSMKAVLEFAEQVGVETDMLLAGKGDKPVVATQ